MLLGKHIDGGRGLPAVWLTFGSLAAVIVLRAISIDIVAMAVIANALGALVVCLYMPTLMTSVYNQAKRSPCPLRFHVATEGGWDIGGASGCVAAATLVRVRRTAVVRHPAVARGMRAQPVPAAPLLFRHRDRPGACDPRTRA